MTWRVEMESPPIRPKLRNWKTTQYCLESDKWGASRASMEGWDFIGPGDGRDLKARA